jgi:hypothetical protein
MKKIAILAAASLVLGLAACNKDTKTADAKASPGAVTEKKSDCSTSKDCCKGKDAKHGGAGGGGGGGSTSKDCCKGKDAKDCCKTGNTSAGAVSEKKDCSSSCSEKKSSCSETKNTSAGAVSGKSGCPGSGSGGMCPFAGAKNG